MEKGVKVIFFVMLLVLSMGFISAGTKVTIKTLQYHQVQVIVADGTIKDYSKIADFKGDADQYGDFSFNLNTSKPSVDLYVHVKRYSDEIAYEKFVGEKTGAPIHLEVAPEGYDLIETPTEINQTNSTRINETLLSNETANETNSEVLSNSKITGSAINNFFKSSTFYYIIIFIVLLIIIFFVVRFFRRRKSNDGNQEIKVRKLSEIQQEKKEDYRSVIEDAEGKIKEAQDELRRLKNEEQIKAMRRKIAEDENELIKLRHNSGFY